MIIFILLWAVIGLVSIVINWISDLDLKVKNVFPLICFGVLVGPIIGTWDLICFVSRKTVPINCDGNRILIARRKRV